MKYRGKDIEIIGEKTVFGKRTAWIRLVEDNSFQQVLWDDIDSSEVQHQDVSHVRFIALASRIKEVHAEAVREGFKQCFKDKDFATILLVGDKIPQNILTEDEVLLQYYDIAQMRS